jgi:ATP-binding cassette subfamily F protein 3
MLRVDRISKVYPNSEPLIDVSFEVGAGERVGLIGPNGAGKTTLFKIIMGEIEPTSGDIVRPAGTRIAYLSQEFEFDPTNVVHDELLTTFSEAHAIKAALHAVQVELEYASPDGLDSKLKKLDRLQREFEHADGYGLERKVDKILPDIGFSAEAAQRLVSTFSGGWQMRIGFGKLLLREPQLLLLDEPTNHIDLETIEWLEQYLLKQTIPMMVVSHDRRFLDRICTKIVELERGTATVFSGNYSAFVAFKEAVRQAQQAAYDRQQEELERQQAFIERFRASATRSTQAKSREKQLDKLDLVQAPLSELDTLEFRFPQGIRSGKEVAEVSELTHAYGNENLIFMDANLSIARGDKIALLGPNGSGKSTLLRLLTGQEKPLDGTVKLGEHNIVPAYFEQNQAEAMDIEKTALATIADAVPPDWKDAQIRGLLGRFLFGGDTVFKRVKDLSGGEKARLALAKLLTKPANFFILDEPTNHLDIPAKETLESALKKVDGTVIVVSHDRYFLSQVANKVVEIRDGGFKIYHGGYDYYVQKVEEEKQRILVNKLETERQVKLAEKRAKAKTKNKAKAEKKKQK